MTELQDAVNEWLNANWDPNLSLIEWRTRLTESGWGAPTWPEDCYGRGLSKAEAETVEAAFAAFGAVGAAHAGPRGLAAVTLMAHGSAEQKRRYLHGILTGADNWCQLFSEPGSGSDLAGATTRAELDGDAWRVNGQKVWTTSAHHADFGLLLARTDWDVPKHQGLSYFILDMRQAGVEVRRLKQMNGYASFNEVFVTDAQVAREDLLGNTGQGWEIALTTLAHERRAFDRPRGVDAYARSERVFVEYQAELDVANEPYVWYPQRAGRVDLIIERAKTTGAIHDPVIRQNIAKLLTAASSARWTAERAQAAQRAGKPPGPEGSLGKLAASNIARAAAAVHTEITGVNAMLSGADSAESGLIAEILLSVPAISIAGGTDEIQRNIIAERVLGLPKEPRFDTGPFKDVPRNTTHSEL